MLECTNFAQLWNRYMKKLPKNSDSPALLTPQETQMFQPDNIIISIKNGIKRVEGFNQKGEKIILETYSSGQTTDGGYQHKSMSVCGSLPVDERRQVASELRDQGYTQIEIAKRLGVSQKTISNDLNEV